MQRVSAQDGGGKQLEGVVFFFPSWFLTKGGTVLPPPHPTPCLASPAKNKAQLRWSEPGEAECGVYPDSSAITFEYESKTTASGEWLGKKRNIVPILNLSATLKAPSWDKK